MAKKKAVMKKTATTTPAASPVKKKVATTTVTAPANAPAATPHLPKVRIQMFRQGLGDSFLITFDDNGPNERRMLIDCGTLGNMVSNIDTASIAVYLQALVNQGKKIDVLVATHEHQDHVSGFKKDLQPVLKGNVGQVWLAWTENPADPRAVEIAKYANDLGSALQRVTEVAPNAPVTKIVQDLLGFAGDVTLKAKFAETVHSAMEFVRSGTGGATSYHKPGDLIENQLPGFRVYVLGPPREDKFLKDVGSHESEELYGLATALGQTAAALLDTTGTLSDPRRPFDERFNQSGAQVRDEQYSDYTLTENSWRRIDTDWLNASSELALQLDNITNNTSLALAFERIADGKVLLFPADAQQGNWLSWHEPNVKWSITDASGVAREVVAADLLARTVFYKVGHHSSHNATARGKGLELMTRQDELVAFIPVDRAMALTRNPKASWQMPARPLYKELLKRCQGRVVRADLGWAAPAAQNDKTEEMFLDMEPPEKWAEWADRQKSAKHVSVTDPLFVEYLLE